MIAERTVVEDAPVWLLFVHERCSRRRQHEAERFAELIICASLLRALATCLCVAFVYPKRFGIGHESLHFPFVWFLRTPYLGRGICVSAHPGPHPVGIGRGIRSLASAFLADIHFVQISVAQGCGRELYLPRRRRETTIRRRAYLRMTFHFEKRRLGLMDVAWRAIRGTPSAVGTMKAKIVVESVSKSLQRARAGGEFLLLVDCILMAPFNGCGRKARARGQF